MPISSLLWSAARNIGGSKNSPPGYWLVPDCWSPDRCVRPVTKSEVVGGISTDLAPWCAPSVTKCCLLMRRNRSAAKEKMVDASPSQLRFAIWHLLFSRFDESQVGKSDEIHLACRTGCAGRPSQSGTCRLKKARSNGGLTLLPAWLPFG